MHLLSAQVHHFQHFTTKDGLPSNSLYGCIQDKDNFIWVYSEKGIAKFDGYKFRIYTVADGLPTNDVWGLTEDEAGRIWIHGYAKEAAYLWKDSIYSQPIEGKGILEVTPAENGQTIIWTGDINDHYVFDGRQFTKKVCNNNIAVNPLFTGNPYWHLRTKEVTGSKRFIFYDHQEMRIVNCEGDTVGIFPQYNLTAKGQKILLNRHRVFYHKFNGSDFWINGNGVIKITYKKDQIPQISLLDFRDLIDLPPKNNAQYILADSTIQLSTDVGLLVVDKNLKMLDYFDTRYLTEKGISFTRRIKDREGNIWMATENRGLYLLTQPARQVQTHVPHRNPKITATFKNGKKVFFGTEDGAVYTLENGNLALILPSGNQSNPVIRMNLLEKKALLVVKDRETDVVLNDGRVQDIEDYMQLNLAERAIIRKNRLVFTAMKHFAYDVERQRFLFAHFSGLHQFTKQENGHFTYQLLSNRRTIGVCVGKGGKIWTAHDDGLRFVEAPGKLEYPDTNLHFRHKIFALAFDGHRVWAGTDGKGVYGYDGQKIDYLPSFTNEIIEDIYIAKDSAFWIATNRGLKTFKRKVEDASYQLIKVYDRKIGLPSNEINAVHVESDSIFIGTDEGLTVFDKRNTLVSDTSNHLKLTRIEVNGIPIDTLHIKQLAHNQNELRFYFVNLSYKSLGNISYQYFLKNADTDWQTTDLTQVRYPNLSPGHYTFYLKSKDITGKETILSQPFEVYIMPPWWQTKLFYTLIGILGIGLVIGIFQWQVYRIKQKSAAEYDIQRRFGELELQALRAQMNPHFIFNCLNGIQNFMLNQQSTEAVAYLGKFGQLMRLFLEASKNKFISLDREIALLQLYTDLEQMRFSNSFHVYFEVSPDLDTEIIQVPSLLIQPFVENAILHGLTKMESTTSKYLKIRLFENEWHHLICIVEDNGIGREKAASIVAKSPQSHKSRATQIVNERLEVLQQIGNVKIRIEVKDLLPESEFVGTSVRLEMEV